MLVAVLVMTLDTADDESRSVVVADVDNSGRVDIADVLALARQRDPERLRQDELDAFALQVVSLANWEDAS